MDDSPTTKGHAGHYKTLMDNKYLGAWDVPRDLVVTIDHVEGGELISTNGKTQRKPFLFFRGQQKPLVLNATNAKTITKLIGTPNCSEWIGKQITIYADKTKMGPDVVDCIRVRPVLPVAPKAVAAK